MRNRPLNPHLDQGALGPAPSVLDAAGRIRLLCGLIAAGLLAICGRVGFVQLGLCEDYSRPFERLVERREPIPTTDGRILASRGELLAEDVPVYEISVHYGWIEDPPDPIWLRQQALSRLERTARRDWGRVAQEEQKVLAQRELLWRRLAETAQSPRDRLSRARQDIQRRVEAIYRRVAAERQRAAASKSSDEALAASAPGWRRVWNAVATALTTPPRREQEEPLIIQEQRGYHRVLADVPFEAAVEVEAHPEWFPGTRVEVRSRRVYPAKGAAPHVIGFRAKVSPDWIAQRRRRLSEGDPLDYQAADRIGRTGLEARYERQLRGLRGERKVFYNRRGEVVSTEVVREPRPGKDLRLTLELPLQRAAELILDEALASQGVDEASGKPLPLPVGGAIVALDVRTGAVLALASAPRFDPQILLGDNEAGWRACLEDPRKPLFHRAVAMQLPPGSVFKVASTVAFLESGRFDPNQQFHCQGYLNEPDRFRCLIFRQFGAGHGDVDLVDALARSCNVYFFSHAGRLGTQPILYWASQLGLGEPTGIDLPGERSGHLPQREGAVAAAFDGRPRQAGNALQLSIGQGSVTVTPIQMARLMALVANGGRLVVPHLAESAGLASLAGPEQHQQFATDGPAPPTTDFAEAPSAETLDWVRAGLAAVVADPHGTGYKTVRHDLVTIAGKTGTAEVGGGRADHAWFVGYAPADKPRVSFVVVLEHGGSGGKVAGPVARSLVQAMLELGIVRGAGEAAYAN